MHDINQTPRHTAGWLRALCLATALLPGMASHALAYQLVDLGMNVSPTDINNNGTVVGYRTDGTTRIAVRIPSGGNVEDLVGGVVAYAVNDNELVAGTTLTGAFLYDGTLKDLGDDYTALGINALGQISGSQAGTNPYRATPRPVNPAIYDPNAHGQNWQVLDVANVYPRGTRQGVYADLYYLFDINDAGYAVGRKSRYGLVGSAPFMTTPDFKAVTFLPIPSGGTAVAINNANRVTGTNGDAHAHAYVYDLTTGVYTDLGTLNNGLRSSASDINDGDMVVGSAWLSTVDTSVYDPTLYHAFVWTAAAGMVDLNTLAGAADWLLTSASAINERGDIVGTAIVGGQTHGFLLANDAPPPPTNNQAPVAAISTDVSTGRAPLTVNFNASGSTDPDGDTLTFVWDFGDGTTGTGIAATHIYVNAGTYMVTLTVSDGQLSDAATVDIKVRNGGRK